MNNRFDAVSKNQFSSATGFPLVPSTIKNADVITLQRALNTSYGASLVEDGFFGNKTKSALQSAGFNPTSVSYEDFNAITSSKQPLSTTMTEAQLKALYNQQKASGKTTDDYATWLRKEQRLAKLKQVGSGIFQVGMEWLKAKQMGSGAPTGDGMPYDQQTQTRTGIPTFVWVLGGAVVLALAIVVISSVVRSRGARVPQGGFQPA